MLLVNSVDPVAKLIGEWSINITFGSIILRLILATLLSLVIGLERSSRNHAAGLRTYAIVTIGSTVAMLTNQFLFESTGGGDGARLGAQVISGIGFLGAGTIMVTSRNQIRGLTTAAGLWACACIGLAVGAGFYTLSICAIALLYAVFTILQSLENHFKNHSKYFTIHIELSDFSNLRDLMIFIRKQEVTIERVELNQAYQQSGLAVYTIYLSNKDKDDLLHIPFIQSLKKEPYVCFVEEIS